jgi:biotin synthase-like enzyme
MFKDLQHKKIRFFLTQSNDTWMYLFKEFYFWYLINLLIDKIGFKLVNIEAEIVFPFQKYFNGLINKISEFREDYFIFYFENSYHSNYYWYEYIIKCLDELKKTNSKIKVILYSLKISEKEALDLMGKYDFIVLCIRTDIEYFFNEYFYNNISIENIDNIIYRDWINIHKTEISNVDYDLSNYIIWWYYSWYLDKFVKSKDYIINIMDDDEWKTSKYISTLRSKDFKINQFRYSSNVSAMISTWRWCKYKCSYCFRGVKYSKVRQIPLDIIKKDLDYLKSMHYEEIYIYDDCFLTTNFDRLESLINLLNQYDFYYWISIRYEMCIAKTFELLKSMKFYRIQIWLQSISSFSNTESGRGVNIDKFRQIVKYFRKNWIKISIDLILWLPWDTLKDFIDSFNFTVKLDPGSIHINSLFLNPGTKLYEKQKEYWIKLKKDKDDLFIVSWIESSDTFSKLDFEIARRYVWKVSDKLTNTKVLLR